MEASAVQFGIGKRCINPQVPVSLGGYFNTRMWEGVLDDIFVHALVLRHEGRIAAIVYFETLTVTTRMAERIYTELEKQGELGRHNTILCASHSHTAPLVNHERPGFSQDYAYFLIRKAVEAIRDACGNTRSGELMLGGTANDKLAFNRRFWMKDGSVVTNPGKMNPEIVKPEGPVDPSIPLLGIRCGGQLKVLLANISNHGDTIGGNFVSGDWMGFCRRQLEERMGANSMCLPLIAPSGNINHFNVSTPVPQTSYEEARRIGTEYAKTIAAALPAMEPAPFSAIKTASVTVETGPRAVDKDELREAEAIARQYSHLSAEQSGHDLTAEDFANRSPVALKFFADATIKAAKDECKRGFNLVGIAAGPMRIVSLPSEVFVEIGMTIRQDIFPDNPVMIATHSGTGADHLSGGYIPNAFNYGRGGYETTHRSNPFDTGTADKLIDGVRQLKEQL